MYFKGCSDQSNESKQSSDTGKSQQTIAHIKAPVTREAARKCTAPPATVKVTISQRQDARTNAADRLTTSHRALTYQVRQQRRRQQLHAMPSINNKYIGRMGSGRKNAVPRHNIGFCDATRSALPTPVIVRHLSLAESITKDAAVTRTWSSASPWAAAGAAEWAGAAAEPTPTAAGSPVRTRRAAAGWRAG